MAYKILKKEDYIENTWAGGVTNQLMIYPKESTLQNRDFQFRVSSATCGPDENKFSDFTGFNRYITPLDAELKLINSGEEVNLKPFEILLFDGGDETASYSAVRDFNLILKKGITGSMRSETITDMARFKITGGMNLLFNYDAHMKLVIGEKEYNLMPFEALFVEDKDKSGEELIIELSNVDREYTNILVVEVEI